MLIPEISSKEIANNLKRIRKGKKISQKKLADMIDKTERTVQNYEAGQTDFTISILKDVAIALDIDYRELLATEEHPYSFTTTANEEVQQDKYALDSFADIINILFKVEASQSISMKLDVRKPPEDKEWNTSISVAGKGTGKFDMDFCLFLENWKSKLEQLDNGMLSETKYKEWQDSTINYYSDTSLNK